MAYRSTATIAVRFSLVSIQMSAYKGTNDRGAGLERHQYHNVTVENDGLAGPCNGRVTNKSFCAKCNVDVASTDIAMGYDMGGRLVFLTLAETESLKAAVTEGLEIDTFINEDDLDSVYLDEDYKYLMPTPKAGKGNADAFAVFHAGLDGKLAIGKWVARGRERLVAIGQFDGGLIMRDLRPHGEIRKMADMPGYAALSAAPDVKALKLMHAIVDSLSEPFDPSANVDQQVKNLEELLAAKLEGTAYQVVADAPAVAAPTSNMLAQLEASLLALVPKPKKVAKVTPIKRTRKKAA